MSEQNPTAPNTNPSDAASGVTEDQLKQAFHAFKKRLKLTKLDQESKLGASRPMTAGKQAGDIAIVPPNQFPREVWQALAKQGKIKDAGGGFYKMP